MIGVFFIDPAHVFKMLASYKDINVPESSYEGQEGGRTDNLKLLILSRVLENSMSKLSVSDTAEYSNFTMFLPKYNSNRRAVSKPTAAFFYKSHIEYKHIHKSI